MIKPEANLEKSFKPGLGLLKDLVITVIILMLGGIVCPFCSCVGKILVTVNMNERCL